MLQEDVTSPLDIQDEHPLAAELASLRATLSRYQHESHTTAVRLQRQSLDSSHAFERVQGLERENAVLRIEIASLRANPAPLSHAAQQQVAELTLALRHVSDQRTLGEEALLVRTKELTHALSEARRAHVELAYVLAGAGAARARENAALAREREMAATVRAADEERMLVDGVVRQYADLVRSLDSRHSKPQPSSPANLSATLAAGPDVDAEISTGKQSDAALVAALDEGRAGLQRLLRDSNQEATRLQQEISRLHNELETSQREQEATEKAHNEDRLALAKALVELERLRADDNTAAKMVSRYMKFSQQATNNLQSALETLKSRHAATVATLTAQLASAQLELRDARRQGERLRRVLENLAEDLSREAYGRRREIALRLSALGREERIVEDLHRWRRRAEEGLAHIATNFPYLAITSTSQLVPSSVSEDGSAANTKSTAALAALRNTLERMICDADDLLHSLDSHPTPHNPSGSMGGAARVLLAEDTARTLLRELQRETDRRMELELQVHSALPRSPGEGRGKRRPGHSRAVTLPEVKVPPVPLRVTLGSNAGQYVNKEEITREADTTLCSDSIAPLKCSALVQKHEPQLPDMEAVPSRDQNPGTPVAHPSTSMPLNPEARDVPTSPALSAGVERTSTLSVENKAELHHPVPVPARMEEAAFIAPETDESLSQGSEFGPEPALTISRPDPGAAAPHPLLDDLQAIKHRYDDLTRAFRDCHLALQTLQKDLLAPSDIPIDVSTAAILRTAVERLQDFNEDARVELEIRIADEERLVHGYITFFSLPIDARDPSTEIEAGRFIRGEDERVSRALDGFKRKRGEVEHDVAEVKRVLHSLRAGLPEHHSEETSPTSSALPLDASPSPPVKITSPRGWSAWAGGLLPTSRPSSPAPPTFGSLMTTPRLRHTASNASLNAGSSTSLSARRTSTPALPLLDAMSPPPAQNPFERLGLDLKVAMPAQVILSQTPPSARMLAPKPPPLRPRYSSLFGQSSMLGISAGSKSPLVNGSPRRVVTSPAASISNPQDAWTFNLTTEESKGTNSDVDTDNGDTDIE